METINIEIGDQPYSVMVAKSSKEIKTGLKNRLYLDEDEGMLFDLSDRLDDVWFWMKGVKIPLDLVFIDENLLVTGVFHGKPGSLSKISVPNTEYVLEVNQNSGIQENDKLEFIEDDEQDNNPPVMKVLFQDGSTQAELWGGERIFRREFTSQLIRLCKKAQWLSKRKKDSNQLISLYKRIGKKMFKEIKAQDQRPAEYVETPN